MWWIAQILAIALIAVIHTFNRWASVEGMSFLVRWLANVGGQAVAAPLFILSYTLSPTFFQPWFLGTAILAVLGCVASLVFFAEVITITKILGAALALAGAVLLIL
ncbi:MAG TPA: hypothetical protein ENI23_01195 [bacterium]|nr:hypothetical protein [bacterium]